MADTVIIAPQWSFVQLGDTPDYFTQYECVINPEKCLPIKDLNDIRFQMFATVLSDTPGVAFPRRDWIAYPVPIDAGCDELWEDLIPDFTVRPLRATVISVTDKDGIVGVGSFNVVTSNVDFEDFPTTGGDIIEIGQCFRFLIYEIWTQSTDPTNIISKQFLGCSNCFTRVSEDCFYSQVQYSNFENNYDFYYILSASSVSNPNRVLLPLYLHSLQLPSEESSYRKSNGTYTKLSERIELTAELETDNIPVLWHTKLKVALSHDTLLIFNPNFIQLGLPASTNGITATSTGFVAKEAYELEHPDPTSTLLAKGRTTLTVSKALSLINSNCQ
jgi:hypothetical protein